MTKSAKEGLLAPAFWALIVRNFNLSPGEGEASVLVTCVSCSDRGKVEGSAASEGGEYPTELEVEETDRWLTCSIGR